MAGKTFVKKEDDDLINDEIKTMDLVNEEIGTMDLGNKIRPRR